MAPLKWGGGWGLSECALRDLKIRNSVQSWLWKAGFERYANKLTVRGFAFLAYE